MQDGGVAEDRPELTYDALVYVDRDTTERDLRSEDEHVVARALLAASFDDDARWVFERCLTMVDDPRVGVRWAVALSIGHLAIPGDFVEEGRARVALAALAADPVVRPAATDALADVEHALAIRPDARWLNHAGWADRPRSGSLHSGRDQRRDGVIDRRRIRSTDPSKAARPPVSRHPWP